MSNILKLHKNTYTITLDEQLVELIRQAIALQEAIDDHEHGTMLCNELKAELEDVLEDIALLTIDEFRHLPF
jgi:hypothetical protein